MTSSSKSNPHVVAVTGASGYIGQRIIKRLLETSSIKQIIGIDVNPSPLKHEKLLSLVRDVAAPLDAIFKSNQVDTVLHLAFVLRQLRDRNESQRINVGGAANVLEASAAAGASRIVLMSSSTIYGPHPDNDGLLTEDAPLRFPAAFHYATDKAIVERQYRDHGDKHQDVQVSILRGCVVMGPMVDNFITQALRKPLLIAIQQNDPRMQFVHEEDLIEILWRFVDEPHPGTFNIAGPGTVTWSEVAKMAHKPLLRLPAPFAYGLVNLAWRLRFQNETPGVGLNYIRWPWIVSTDRIEKELGFTFKHSSRTAVESYLGVLDSTHARAR